MGTRVRLWRWSYRWFRPQQKEEFRANVSPAGDLTGFSHELPEDARSAFAGRRRRPRSGRRLPAHHRPSRPGGARIRRSQRNRAAASHRPAIRLEGAGFQPARRHLPRVGLGSGERGRRLRRVSEGPRTLAARLPDPALEERHGPERRPGLHGSADGGDAGGDRDAHPPAGCALAARLHRGLRRHGAGPVRQPEFLSARGIRFSHHRFLRQLCFPRTHRRGGWRAGGGRFPVPHRGRRRTALPGSLWQPDLDRQPVPAARPAHAAFFQRRHSGRGAGGHFHRLSDHLLSHGLQVRRLVAGRRAV